MQCKPHFHQGFTRPSEYLVITKFHLDEKTGGTTIYDPVSAEFVTLKSADLRVLAQQAEDLKVVEKDGSFKIWQKLRKTVYGCPFWRSHDNCGIPNPLENQEDGVTESFAITGASDFEVVAIKEFRMIKTGE